MAVHPQFLKAARVLLGLEQEELARLASVGRRTLAGIERGESAGSARTLTAIQEALEEKGIVFLPSTLRSGPGLRLRSEAFVRMREIGEPRRETE